MHVEDDVLPSKEKVSESFLFRVTEFYVLIWFDKLQLRGRALTRNYRSRSG